MTDKGTYRIPFKESALTHYGTVPYATTESIDRSSGSALAPLSSESSLANPGYDVISGTYYPPASSTPYDNSTAQHMAGAPSPPGQRSAPDYYAKGKRQLYGAGRGQQSKAQRTDPDQNGNKGKGKSSSAHFPRFRDSYIPFLWKYQVQSHYTLYEHKTLPKKGVEFSSEKLGALLGATPTEDDIERSPAIIKAIRHSAQNADAFTYEMFDKFHPRDQTHTAY